MLLMGKSSISMPIFNSKLLVYQRVKLYLQILQVMFSLFFFREVGHVFQAQETTLMVL